MNKANIKLSATEKLTIVSSLAKMLEGGIAMPDAIDALLEDAKKGQKQVLETLRADIQEGKTIAESLEKFPNSFDPISTSLISTGEKSGYLEKNLNQLSSNLIAEIELSGKIKAAIVYPVFVLIVFLSILLMILLFVIPRIATVFSRLKLQLPLPTKILISASSLLRENTIVCAVIILLFVAVTFFLIKKKNNLIINAFSKLPILSSLATQIDLARFTRSLGLMLSAGIPIDEAIALTKNVVHKNNIRQIVANCEISIESGKKLSDEFKKNRKIIPSIMTRMIEVGEKSGSLENTLLNLSTHFQGKIDNSIKTLTILMEPILLVIIGVLVGGIMLSIIAPIYSLIGNISPR